VTVDCDCAAFAKGDVCSHIVAATLSLRATLGAQRTPAPSARQDWELAVSDVLRNLSAESATRRGGGASAPVSPRTLLFFSIQERASGRWGIYLYSLAASRFSPEALGTDGRSPDSLAIARAIKMDKLSGHATAVRTFDPVRFPLTAMGERQAARAILQAQQHGYYSYHTPAGQYEQILPLLVGTDSVYRGTELNPLRQRLDVLPEGTAQAALSLSEAEEGLRLAPTLLRASENGDTPTETPLDGKNDQFIFKDPPYLLTGKGLLVPLGGVPAAFRTLAERRQRPGSPGAAATASSEILIPPDARERFFEQYLLPLTERLPITGDGIVWEDETPVPPVPRLYLTEVNGTLRVHLRFAYGDLEVPYDPALPIATVQRGTSAPNALRRIRRDPQAEQDRQVSIGVGGAFGLKRDEEPGAFVLRARVDPVDFLLHHAPRLVAEGCELYGEENLSGVRVNRSRPTLSLGVSSGIDWFDVEAVLKFGDVEAALADVKKAIRKRERYVKLADGSIGVIPPDWIERFRFLFALGEETENGLRLSSTQALLLDQAIADAGGDIRADAEFAARREQLRGFEQITPVPLPETGLNAHLYPYQKGGYDWLHFLHEYGFGGCLADEMGLGKTLQALAFLLSLRQRAGDAPPGPNLVVVPRSLLFNWERESLRFTPELRVRIHADGDRKRDAAALADGCDLLLTTYGILLRDIETLRTIRFHYAILDEAQAIKNPLSQTARAARLLSADHRLTLTGTPVENGTLEMWSQFAFLNPGLLGGMERFKEEFAGAIERHQDEAAAHTLRRLTAPFLLRRTKDQVAKDLPPRTENLVYSEMEPAQRRLYDRLRDQFRAQLLGMIGEEDKTTAGGAQMKILEGLLRLRQVCCHPRLVEPEFEGGSAKFTALLETLETLRAEGHKALVFSQFTKMLAILKTELDARGIPYLYLDGKTRDRQSPVDQFQNDAAVPFFLISLKAGGVGLNLTAADYVLHIDPWWNPAVERQATDRAHRIGQDKPVFVYKFVAKDSVEEKILALQDRKRALVDQLISAEGGLFKSLTRSDIEALFS
ncbi:MAG: SNF2 helicase associated domain-containing protein, partial [Cytophagales bacterium]|nr:SNF2 helicase associated domain-containing protein [Armatimonadota bacterium]